MAMRFFPIFSAAGKLSLGTESLARMIRLGATFVRALTLLAAQTPTSAGGKWLQIQEIDKKTGVSSTVFLLQANAGYPARQPAFAITCRDSQKAPEVTYRADVLLDPIIHDTLNFYGDAIWATVKVDQRRLYRAVWDIAVAESFREKKVAIVDGKTAKALLSGSEMKVRFEGHNSQEFIDAFTIGGLDMSLLKNACGSRWFEKE
jgi:hypothetical protein